eukprot:3337746-Amphidinium_carterae.1
MDQRSLCPTLVRGRVSLLLFHCRCRLDADCCYACHTLRQMLESSKRSSGLGALPEENSCGKCPLWPSHKVARRRPCTIDCLKAGVMLSTDIEHYSALRVKLKSLVLVVLNVIVDRL